MNNNRNRRMDKFEKRRKNTKLISYLLIFVLALVILLIAVWVFGGNEAEDESANELSQNENGNYFLNAEDAKEESNQDKDSEVDDEMIEEQTDVDGNILENNGAAEEEEDVNKENESYNIQYNETEDDNVISSYRGDWPAIGTTQTGPHTTDYANGSQDRIEIKRAVSMVTKIPEEEIIEVWIGNGGNQKVIATVTNASYTENYHVHLDWIDGEGWKPTTVEVLKELTR